MTVTDVATFSTRDLLARTGLTLKQIQYSIEVGLLRSSSARFGNWHFDEQEMFVALAVGKLLDGGYTLTAARRFAPELRRVAANPPRSGYLVFAGASIYCYETPPTVLPGRVVGILHVEAVTP